MKRFNFKKLIFSIFIILILVCEGKTSFIEVTDKLGRKLTIKVPVKRAIIAVTPELIPALDIWDQVIGVSDWAEKGCSIYRAFIFNGLKQRKPTVASGMGNLVVEAILKLNPDVVITWNNYNSRVINFLESKGIKVISISPDSIKELYDVIRLYGKLFGKEKRAEAVISEMENLFNFIKRRTAKIPYYQRKKVLLIGGKPTAVSGKIGVTNDVIELIGGINVAGEINASYADVSMERIIRWNPDVIFIWSFAGYNEYLLYNNSQWKFVKAVRNRKVYKLPHWSTWSPRLASIALYMAIKTYPELFKDVNFEKIIDNFYKKIFGISYYIVKEYEKY